MFNSTDIYKLKKDVTKLQQDVSNQGGGVDATNVYTKAEVDAKIGEVEKCNEYILNKMSSRASNILHVATFNAWRMVHDKAKFRKYVSDNLIDIIGFQEGRGDELLEACKVFDVKNHELVRSSIGQCNIILSSMKLIDTEDFRLPGAGEDRYLIKSSIIFGGRKISVYNAHLDASDENEVRDEQIRWIKRKMDMDETEYIILMGDFNVRSNDSFDIFRDYYTPIQGHKGVYHPTWPDVDGSWGTSSIDNIIVTNNIGIHSVTMPEDMMGSDHRMLHAELLLKEPTISSDLELKSIVVDEAMTITEGTTHKLQIGFIPGRTQYKNFSIVSSDVAVATVDATGIITAIAPGSTVITVTSTHNPEITVDIAVTIIEDKAVVKNGLMRHIDFRDITNEGSPKSVQDLSGNNNHIDLFGFSYNTSSGFNNGLVHDTTNDYFKGKKVPTKTFELKMSLRKHTLKDGLISMYYDEHYSQDHSNSEDHLPIEMKNQCLMLYLYSNNAKNLNLWCTNDTQYDSDTGYAVPLNTPVHYAFTIKEPNLVGMYINGEYVKDVTLTKNVGIDGSLGVMSGKLYNRGSIAGATYHVIRQYDRLLTAAEIKKNYLADVR